MELKLQMRTQKYLVQSLATSGLVTLAANDSIMSGILIQWLRHLKHQNWLIILDFINRNT